MVLLTAILDSDNFFRKTWGVESRNKVFPENNLTSLDDFTALILLYRKFKVTAKENGIWVNTHPLKAAGNKFLEENGINLRSLRRAEATMLEIIDDLSKDFNSKNKMTPIQLVKQR